MTVIGPSILHVVLSSKLHALVRIVSLHGGLVRAAHDDSSSKLLSCLVCGKRVVEVVEAVAAGRPSMPPITVVVTVQARPAAIIAYLQSFPGKPGQKFYLSKLPATSKYELLYPSRLSYRPRLQPLPGSPRASTNAVSVGKRTKTPSISMRQTQRKPRRGQTITKAVGGAHPLRLSLAPNEHVTCDAASLLTRTIICINGMRRSLRHGIRHARNREKQ